MAKEENIDYALRVSFYSLLNGNVNVNGQEIPVFNSGSYTDVDMYIFIQSTGNIDNSIKVGIDTISSTQLTLFAKGDDKDGTEIEDMAAQVLKIIAPYNGFVAPINANFQVKRQSVMSDIQIPVMVRDTTVKAWERHIIIESEVNHIKR